MHDAIRSQAARRLLVVGLAGMLSLAACGSSSSGGTGSSATTAAAAGGATATTTARGSDTTAKASDSSGSGSANADDMVAAFNAVAKGDCAKAERLGNAAFGEGDTESTDPFGDLAEIGKAFEKLASSGPSELRGDFGTLAKVFVTMGKAYKDLGLDDPSKMAEVMKDPAKAAKLAELGEQMDGAEVTAASERITAWVEEKCPGLDKS